MATDEVAPSELLDPDRTVEMDVYEGRPPIRVLINAAAPFGWWPAVVLALVSFMDRLEQSVLAGAATSIKEHFGIGNFGIGVIAAATSIAGLVLFIPAGRIADRTHRPRALAFVLVSWSLLSIGTGLAVTFAMLVAMRTLIGAAGQLNNPAGSSLLADFYPGATRTKVFAIERYIYFLANPVGVVVGAIVAETYGWQWVFLGLVPPGILVAIACLTLKNPVRGTADRIDALRAGRDDEVVETPLEPVVGEEAASVSVWEDVRALWAVPSLRALYLAQGALYWGLGGLFLFTPIFFHDELGVEEAKSGSIAGMIGLVGVTAGVVVGVKLGAKYHGVRPGWRIMTAAIGILIAAVGVGILVVASSVPVAALGFVVVNFGLMMAMPNLLAAVADVCGAARRGMGFSVNQMVVGVSALAPLYVGFTSEKLGFAFTYASMIPPFLIAIVLLVRARHAYERDVQAVIDEELAA